MSATVLAIETSTHIASVAVLRAQDVFERLGTTQSHSIELLPMVQEVLDESEMTLADIDRLAVSVGPGSFTGLRIGLATAKGLAFTLEKPLFAVSSLAALAAEMVVDVIAGDELTAVLDAGRGEVFVGEYLVEDGQPLLRGEERVMTPAELIRELASSKGSPPPSTSWIGGPGFERFRETLLAAHARPLSASKPMPTARAVAHIARRQGAPSGDLLAPVYIRKAEAEIRFPNGNPGGAFSTHHGAATSRNTRSPH